MAWVNPDLKVGDKVPIMNFCPVGEDGNLVEDDWGKVDKDKLLDYVLSQKNPMSTAKKIYLKIDSDWKDHPRTAFHYPVADKNGNIYRYALSSALTFAKANNDREVISKVESLYKKYNIEENTESNRIKISI